MPENNEQGKKQYRIGSVERSEEKNDHLKQIKSKLYKNDLLSTFCLTKESLGFNAINIYASSISFTEISFSESVFIKRGNVGNTKY